MSKIPDREIPFSPTQAYLDHMIAGWQQERAARQMTLGDCIDRLSKLEPDSPLLGIAPHLSSYRGYYVDLAFEPSDKPSTVGAVLTECRNAMGRVFTGYKGGDYLMGEHTPLWVAAWGSCGDMLIGWKVDEGTVRAVTRDPDSENGHA